MLIIVAIFLVQLYLLLLVTFLAFTSGSEAHCCPLPSPPLQISQGSDDRILFSGCPSESRPAHQVVQETTVQQQPQPVRREPNQWAKYRSISGGRVPDGYTQDQFETLGEKCSNEIKIGLGFWLTASILWKCHLPNINNLQTIIYGVKGLSKTLNIWIGFWNDFTGSITFFGEITLPLSNKL